VSRTLNPGAMGRTSRRTLDRDALVEQRERWTAQPFSDERKRALRKIRGQLKNLAYRSPAHG
jgi:hypothetical protein